MYSSSASVRRALALVQIKLLDIHECAGVQMPVCLCITVRECELAFGNKVGANATISTAAVLSASAV